MPVRIHKEKVTQEQVQRVLALGLIDIKQKRVIPARKAQKVCLPYDCVKHVINSLGITTREAYNQLYRAGTVCGLPVNPSVRYKDDGWISWELFLNIPEKTPFMGYADAKRYIISKGIRSREQYRRARNAMEIVGVPVNPKTYYEEWDGWECFTGKDILYGHMAAVICFLERGYRQDIIEKYPDIRETIYNLSNPSSPDYNREFATSYGFNKYFGFSLD